MIEGIPGTNIVSIELTAKKEISSSWIQAIWIAKPITKLEVVSPVKSILPPWTEFDVASSNLLVA
jgi:hypothetical protein